MTLRYLLGPLSGEEAWRYWPRPRQHGHCRVFNAIGDVDVRIDADDTWEQVCQRLPTDWHPDFIALHLPFTTVPPALWTAPLPLIGLAGDWDWHWHAYRHLLPHCDLVLADTPGVEALRRAGIRHVQAANLRGLDRHVLEEPRPQGERSLDIVFVGMIDRIGHRHRAAWLGRLARLAGRWRVALATGVSEHDYHTMLSQARIVFNHSRHGECNRRVFEAAAAGALLFQEADNREVPQYFEPGREYIAYQVDNLEVLLEHYLTHEDERRAIAEAARVRVQAYSFDTLWQEVLEKLSAEWNHIQERARQRVERHAGVSLSGRVWQAASSRDGGDPHLVRDLRADLEEQPATAELHNALGLALSLPVPANQPRDPAFCDKLAVHFRQALASDPHHAVAGLNLIESLVGAERKDLAVQAARHLLVLLERGLGLHTPVLDAAHFPLMLGDFHEAWQRAGWNNAGQPVAEAEAKRRLLRWRLHELLADLTRELVHYHEAARAWPDNSVTQARLGCALGLAKQSAAAAGPLQRAVLGNPFDFSAARALYQALLDRGDTSGARRLAYERRWLAQVAPRLVPIERWFAEVVPPAAVHPADHALAVCWEGPFLAQHSLGLVCRALVRGLQARGHQLSLLPIPSPGPQIPPGPERQALEERFHRTLSRPADVTVRMHWPPRWDVPAQGHWVVFQPWEFGSIPRDWLSPLRDAVDEVWVPSRFVRDSFVQSGVPAEKLQVIPHGVDTQRFQPGLPPYPLRSTARYKFLFVGGTIYRKGIDLLLAAYGRAFTRRDDVCLVIKDMGVGSFYRGQTAESQIARFQAEPEHPELEYLDAGLSDEQLPSLYAACDCLVHPYRGEGFGLPIVEAMGCGLPVVVTNYGAALDFCDPDNAYLIPATLRYFPEKRLGDRETVDYPWLAEPDTEALATILREVVSNPEQARRRGAAGRERVLQRLTWEHAVESVETRLRALAARPSHRSPMPLQPAADEPLFVGTNHEPAPRGPLVLVHGHLMRLHNPATDRWISAPLAGGAPYEPFETELLLSQVGPGDVVLDLGANLGYYTLLFARQVGPAGKVFAFEPGPANFALLRENVERNGYRNVVLVRKAVADRTGTARLYHSADNQGDHRLHPASEPRSSVEVETVTLDEFFADYRERLDLIKMDIQGAEGAALEGMESLLRRCGPVQLATEFWPEGLRQAGSSAGHFLQQLGELGFRLYRIHEGRRAIVPMEAASLLRDYPEGTEAFTNLLCLWEGASIRQKPADRPLASRIVTPDGAGRGRVSLCLIVKNEENNLPACLGSAADLVDEVIVVDTGSTDATKEVAARYGARIFDFPWCDSFSAARNECLRHATGQWIFWLDADDRLDEDNRVKLRTLFSRLGDENLAFSMKCLCLPDPVSGASTLVDHIRLFRNHPEVRWQYRVHEQILPAIRRHQGEVCWTDVVIQHTGYQDPTLRRKKLQRDLRLLQLEDAEHPDDAFTLFNLGSISQELGQHTEAIPLLRRSLERSHPGDSIVRKLYALLVGCHRALDQAAEALAVCQRGRQVYPDDTELLFVESILRKEQGDLAGSETCLVQLLNTQPAVHFGSVDAGLKGYKARHNLAVLRHQQNRPDEAESLWRQVVAERPDFVPAWLGLGEVHLRRGAWDALEEVARHVEQGREGAAEATVLRGRAHLARKEFATARYLLEEAISRWPEALGPRLVLSHVLLQEGRDVAAAEKALHAILELAPDHAEARNNLALLRQRHGQDLLGTDNRNGHSF